MARRNPAKKTALVTGASRGIGRAIAQRLIVEGVRVVGLTRDITAVEPLEGILWLQCDLGNAEALADLLASEPSPFAEVSILINNAGFSDFGPLEKLPSPVIAQHLQVLLSTPIALTQALLPGMLESGEGSIINVSSLAAELPIPYLPVYNAAKAGLAGFTQSLMLDLAESPVQVVDFRPGDYRTQFYAASRLPANLSEREKVAWEQLRKKTAEGALPEQAAEDLWNSLSSGRSGIVRSGSWFQTQLASLAGRFLPEGFMRRRILRYYKL
jgi:short-subunit dehydrogenase